MARSSTQSYFALAALLLLSLGSARGQGVIAPSAGPINGSMAGASTAAPVDFGASYWNPATISFLDREEMLLSSQLSFPSLHYSSALRAGSINGVFPPTNRYGTARSDSGVPTNLAVGGSFKLDDESPLTMGLGIFGLVGGGVNFAGSYVTPTLGPRQPPNYFGLGPIYANMALLSIVPTASAKVTDRLALAVSPVITTGTVQFSPAFFAPGPADRYGIATFPAAVNSRPFWGAGFQVGLLYELNDDWNLGFSYKSPVWQEKWTYNTSNPDGSPRTIGIQGQIPAIYSWGVAYKGIENLIVDVDLRYFDYSNTQLFGQSIQSGGLDWSSVFAVAVGGRYQLNDRVALMAGYLYNQNPIDGINTLFNVQAPGFLQNTLALGASLRLNDNIMFSAGWSHMFRNSIQGPVGQIPESTARMDGQIDSILMGLTIQYGGRKTRAEVEPEPVQ